MRELSVFVDESGDFGDYNSKYAPQYIFSMIFHEQENNIEDEIKRFDMEMANLGYFNHVVHASPLIRKEDVYCNLSPNERRTIFTRLFFFAKAAPIKYKSFLFERKECVNETELKTKINTTLTRFIEDNYMYFSSFDKVVLYYDNGQKQLASILVKAFEEKILMFERKNDVKPNKYKLLQVADLICTIELLKLKAEHNALTSSELSIFHSVRDLKKDFLKKIMIKEFK